MFADTTGNIAISAPVEQKGGTNYTRDGDAVLYIPILLLTIWICEAHSRIGG